MAKESMKAREVKRAKLVAKYAEKKNNSRQKVTTRPFNCCRKTHRVYVCTTVAKLPVVPKDISVSLGFPVYSSAKWHRLDLSRA